MWASQQSPSNQGDKGTWHHQQDDDSAVKELGEGGDKERVLDDDGSREHHGRDDDDQEIEAESRDARPSDSRAKDSSLVTAFRDFFLAAFSDNYTYQDGYCCGGAEFLNGAGALCLPLSASQGAGAGGVLPEDQDGLRTQNSSASYRGVADPDLHKSASYDSSRNRRKKPLAVAVGYNYARALDGQPVVITLGGGIKKPPPLDLSKASSRSSRNSRNRNGRNSQSSSIATGDGSNHSDFRRPVMA